MSSVITDQPIVGASVDREVDCKDCGGSGEARGLVSCPRYGASGEHAHCCGGTGVTDATAPCEPCEGTGLLITCGRCGAARPVRYSCAEWRGCETD